MAAPARATFAAVRGVRTVKILVVDIGGNNVKVLVSGQGAPRKVPSGPTLTAARMAASGGTGAYGCTRSGSTSAAGRRRSAWARARAAISAGQSSSSAASAGQPSQSVGGVRPSTYAEVAAVTVVWT